MDALTLDLIGNICGYLVQWEVINLSAVCRRLNQIIKEHPDCWRNIQLNSDPAVVAKLAACGDQAFFQQGTRHISMQFSKRLTNTALQLLRPFKGLTSLNLDACQMLNDRGMKKLWRSCRNLTSLSIYFNPQLSNKTLLSLAAAPTAQSLTNLNLSGLIHITDEAMVPLLRAIPAIRHLDLTRMQTLRDPTLEAVGRYCRSLETLNLYACSGFTDEGLQGLAGCSKLSTLDLCGSHFITDTGIEAVVSANPSLVSLNLAWCVQLGDPSLASVARHLRQLSFLSIHGQKKVTDKGLAELGKGCSRLSEIDVNGCSGLADREEQAIRHLIPSIKTLLTL